MPRKMHSPFIGTRSTGFDVPDFTTAESMGGQSIKSEALHFCSVIPGIGEIVH